VLSSAKIGRSSWRYYQATVAGGACEYYSENGEAPGRWHGSGLPQLGLLAGGVVEERELEALFGRALSPSTGEQLGAAWGDRSVTGYDLTFSAPKSVSALWALGDGHWVTEIETAHAAAVKAGLDYLQQVAGYSRRGRNGIHQVPTAGYTAALFDHGTSRTGDPQLHTHALVVNKARCADGAWRTLDGHEVYHHKKAAGALYQAALRAELTHRLPVLFGDVSEHGQADITAVPEQLLQAWSSRTSAVMSDAVPTIADAEEALGRSVTADERARIIKAAVLATRPRKEHHAGGPDRRTTWAAQAAAHGITPGSLLDAVAGASAASPKASPGATPPVATRPEVLARDALLADAVSVVGRSKAVWSRADLTIAIAARIDRLDEPKPATAADTVALVSDLTDTALEVGPGGRRWRANRGVGPLGRSGVVPLGLDQAGDTARASDPRYASAELVAMEARIIGHAMLRIPLTAARLAQAALDLDAATAGIADSGSGLSAEQREAAVMLLAAQDRISVMTAPAGAGKTTTIGAAVRAWRATGVQVSLLAPSARAAAELTTAAAGAGGTGEAGTTVARWLLTHDNQSRRRAPGGGRSVILVDEASMLSTLDLDRVFTHAVVSGSQVVLVGDPAQIGAVNAPGGMFAHLTELLARDRVDLNELHRFTHPWEADASLRLRAGDPAALRAYLDHDRIHPASDIQDAADAVFDRWQEVVDAGRDALMLAQSWADVTALNTRARAAAIAQGHVHGPDLLTVVSRSASTRGHPEPRSWRAGDLLLAKRNTTSIRLGRRQLRNGDRLRVLDGAPGGGLRVQALHDDAITDLPVDYLARHAEYGWATTIDAGQGATTDIAVLLARTGLDREHLYVAMTRGRNENHVHTTPETDTGDAGPHRTRTSAITAGPVPVDEQQAAVSLLARALATSGSGQAAHAVIGRTQTSRQRSLRLAADQARRRDPVVAPPGDDTRMLTR